jgi:hypothetical protein
LMHLSTFQQKDFEIYNRFVPMEVELVKTTIK